MYLFRVLNKMVKLSRLNKKVFYLNPMMIEQIEKTPDLMITLVNGKKLIVADNLETIIEEMMIYWQCVFHLNKKSEYLKLLAIEDTTKEDTTKKV